jgi:hypothetical protein
LKILRTKRQLENVILPNEIRLRSNLLRALIDSPPSEKLVMTIGNDILTNIHELSNLRSIKSISIELKVSDRKNRTSHF